MHVVISVVIATCNRVNYLEKAIISLYNQSLEKGKYEVIIVDNASTDRTKDMVEDKMQYFKNLIYVYEGTPGTNFARNTGLQRASGKYIAFIDDDAIANPQWLERIIYRFQTINPTPGIVGGKVSPIWEVEKPSWITNKLLGALSIVDYSDQPIFLTNKFLFSVNMAFPSHLLKEYGGFDTRLCRKGKNLITNDEILIASKLKQAGYKFFYDPAIHVEHIIPQTRLHPEWFIRRANAQGFSDAIMWKLLEKPSIVQQVKRVLYNYYVFLRNPKYLPYLFATPDPFAFDKFKLKLGVCWRVSYIKGLFN
jgi:glycosyltransferase involved in cell wall biosynthesis